MIPTAVSAGPLASLLRPISRLLRVGNARYLIGHDLEGNSYYEYPSRSGSTDPRHTRRAIEYRIKQSNYFEYDRSQLPIQWKQWLRHTRRGAPSLEELEQDRQRILQLQENVRLIAIRDEEARQREEQRRLESHGEAMSSARQPQRQTSGSPSGVGSTPPLGQAPDQTKSEAQASMQAPDSAWRATQSGQHHVQHQQAAASPPPSASTSATPPLPRTRSRAPINSIPTSDVNDEGVAEQKQRRVPVSMTHSSTEAHTEEGQRVAGQVVEERQADNDVWKASRERVERQDKGA